jgi:hypothetical protein
VITRHWFQFCQPVTITSFILHFTESANTTVLYLTLTGMITQIHRKNRSSRSSLILIWPSSVRDSESPKRLDLTMRLVADTKGNLIEAPPRNLARDTGRNRHVSADIGHSSANVHCCCCTTSAVGVPDVQETEEAQEASRNRRYQIYVHVGRSSIKRNELKQLTHGISILFE